MKEVDLLKINFKITIFTIFTMIVIKLSMLKFTYLILIVILETQVNPMVPYYTILLNHKFSLFEYLLTGYLDILY